MNKQVKINREKIIKKMSDDSIMILFSGKEIKSSADALFPFVVNRNFYHLTNINQPNLILVMTNDGKERLYIEKSDEMYEKWIGKKISIEEAQAASSVENIKYSDDFIADIVKKYQEVYLDLERDTVNHTLSEADKFAIQCNSLAVEVKDCYELLAKSRSVKSNVEIAEIQKAINITKAALENVMKNMKPNQKESYYESYFDLVLKQENVTHSFPTIAASGRNAVTLHYVTNNEIAKDGDLLLMDLGAAHNLYCADISRTYPVSGHFSERQKELYNMVLGINEIIIGKIEPGITMGELNDIVLAYYQEKLVELNVIKNPEDVKNYYYHGVSHSLGLDTHDVGLARDEKLVPGNIITVEPGIYIKEEGIGIRIEDNILVTHDGNVNLSEHIIKSVTEIENFITNE